MNLYRINVNGVDTGIQLSPLQESIYNQGFVDGMEHMKNKAIDCAQKIFEEKKGEFDGCEGIS